MTSEANPDSQEKESEQKQPPNCFADLNKVFPMRSDGLRHTPETCFECPHKTECLRAAIRKKEGLKVYAEKVDRAYRSGVIGFLERWSKRKELHRKINS